jgi:hypothetical protein
MILYLERKVTFTEDLCIFIQEVSYPLAYTGWNPQCSSAWDTPTQLGTRASPEVLREDPETVELCSNLSWQQPVRGQIPMPLPFRPQFLSLTMSEPPTPTQTSWPDTRLRVSPIPDPWECLWNRVPGQKLESCCSGGWGCHCKAM